MITKIILITLFFSIFGGLIFWGVSQTIGFDGLGILSFLPGEVIGAVFFVLGCIVIGFGIDYFF